jgi:molybdopterin converting factor small subunit
MIRLSITFYSYFKDLAGCERTTEVMPDGSKASDLLARLGQRFPRLAAIEKSALLAVGVEYQPRSHPLQDGDEVALFPPVQGG